MLSTSDIVVRTKIQKHWDSKKALWIGNSLPYQICSMLQWVHNFSMSFHLKLHTIINQMNNYWKANVVSELSEEISRLTYQHRTQTSIGHTLDCRQEEDKQEHMDGSMQCNYCMTRRSLGNILNWLSGHNFHLVYHDTANLDLKIRIKY